MSTITTKEPAAQVAFAKKAAEVKAEAKKPQPVWLRKQVPAAESDAPPATPEQVWAAHRSQGPPRPAVAQVTAVRQATQVRPLLLGRHDVVAMAGVTYPTIWFWMRGGKFPRSRIVGGKSMWVASEIEAWIAALPVRPLKPLDDEAA